MTVAGWYSDSTQPGAERYWDGIQWTDQVRPAVAPSPEPVTAIQPKQPYAQPPGQSTIAIYPNGIAPAQASSGVSTVGNILWLVLAGLWLALGYVLAGIVNCITIIGIPFGIQSFKLAGYALWPFGRVVIQRPNRDVGLSLLGNVIWFIFSGLWLALTHVLLGLLLCITVIGIPLGVASFKMAGLALAPFGKMVIPKSQLSTMPGVVVVSSVG